MLSVSLKGYTKKNKYKLTVNAVKEYFNEYADVQVSAGKMHAFVNSMWQMDAADSFAIAFSSQNRCKISFVVVWS